MNEILFQVINSWAGLYDWLDQLMVFSAEWLGYLMILGLVVFLLIDFKKYKLMAALAIGSAAVSRLVFVTAIRSFYHHLRPLDALSGIHVLPLPWHITLQLGLGYSFPSGHAAFYFALATVVYFHNKKAGYAYFALAGLMGFARVFVGVHWPADIVAGAILGILTSAGIYTVLNHARTKFRPASLPS